MNSTRSTGEPINEANDFYGKAVIQAARIAAAARGSEILVSSLVRDLTESSGEFAFGTPRDVVRKGTVRDPQGLARALAERLGR